jgi:hypothetical protein
MKSVKGNKQKKNKKGNRQTSAPQRPKKVVVNSPGHVGTYLSGCARDYARTLVNPFSGPLACIPSFPVLMTRKMRTWARGSFSTGTNSQGWIAADPKYGAINNSATVYYSTAGMAPVAVDMAAVGVGTANSNSDYALGTVGPAANLYKVVGYGLRFRYTGTSLNQGGTIVALCDPNHNSLQGRSYANFQAELMSKQFPFGREWINVLYKPVTDLELTSQSTFPANTGAATDLCFYMGAYINSAVAAQPFEFEVYGVYEWEGATIRGQTPSHADPVGFAAIQVASLNSPTTVPKAGNDPSKHEASFLKEVGNTLLQTGSTVFGNMIGSGVSGLIQDVSNFSRSSAGQLAIGAAESVAPLLLGL